MQKIHKNNNLYKYIFYLKLFIKFLLEIKILILIILTKQLA